MRALSMRALSMRALSMRAVVQRVTFATVEVAGVAVGQISNGLLVLLSVGQADGPADLGWLVDKVAGLRIFADSAGKMNLDVGQTGGAILVVSQFTLHGDVRRGKRPSFTAAMPPERAAPIVDEFAQSLRKRGLTVAQGVFAADMQVSSCNDGPVTILLDSSKLF